ncbi:hypothetical protein TSUD_206040 [Trifolium subterraneum]|uniref:Uncharacterized protein n=1 Tax=Trifolium subterraneum TaxID=3900 RepID=A0A2Z6NEK3_TRISU|nr:hypothetical protein TSUD_206040 [Trifolium subterraneum]
MRYAETYKGASEELKISTRHTATGHNTLSSFCEAYDPSAPLEVSKPKVSQWQAEERDIIANREERKRYAFDHPDRLSQVMASTALTGMTSKCGLSSGLFKVLAYARLIYFERTRKPPLPSPYSLFLIK